MTCPICHNRVTATMRDMERVLAPHRHSEVVLVCPGSNRTAKEAMDIAKAEDES